MGDIFALVSAGGSPGATTAAVALALTWPSDVILAECDPSGGDILAGLLSGHVPAGPGLMEHAMEAGRDRHAAAASLPSQLVALEESRRSWLLPGLTDPRQAAGLAPSWPAIAGTLAAQPADVIVDCGRCDSGPSQPLAILAAAQAVALVLRPTLRQVWAARPRADILRQLLGDSSRLALLITGPGTHSAGQVAHVLGLPVAATLPDDARTAGLLSDGVGGRRQLGRGQLMRSARSAGQALRSHRAVVPTRDPASTGAVR